MSNDVSDATKLDSESWPRRMAQPNAVQPGTRPARPLVHVSEDGIRCTFTGDSGCVAVLAEQAVPKSTSMFYFEMKVIDAGAGGNLAIGLAPERFKHNLPPGHMRHSYGYHGHDGGIYSGAERTPLLSHGGYTTGDVVGVGVHHKGKKCSIYFTKNGRKLPYTLLDEWKQRGSFMPAVCLGSKGECIEVNFGRRPFVFSHEADFREEDAQWRQATRELPVARSALQRLVAEYLATNAHVDTLAKFEAATHPKLDGPAEVRPIRGSMHHHGASRKAACCAIRAGEAARGAAIVEDIFPGLLDMPLGLPAKVHLNCQVFIEMVKAGDVDSALRYGQQHLWPLRHRSPLRPEEQRLLQETPALLAYEDPCACGMAALVAQSQRDAVADVVNSTMLVHSRSLKRRSGAAKTPPAQAPSERSGGGHAAEDASAVPQAAEGAPESAAAALDSDEQSSEAHAELGGCRSGLRAAMEQLEMVFAELQAQSGGYGDAVTVAAELDRPMHLS